jgi:oligopeptide transport system substrate-binding protein
VGRLVALTAAVALVLGCSGSVPLDRLLDRGPTLRVHAGEPQTLDPALVGDSVSWSYLIQIHSGLVRLDQSLAVVPDLADRWELSPDGTTYTFSIRPGARFHSGREVVAEDFVYAMRRALDPATGSTTAGSYLGDIADLRAVDPRTLEIRLDAPKSYFLAKLTHPIAYPLDRANIESDQRWFERPNGTGPFRLTSWERDVKITLLRFNDYWAGAARVRELQFDFSPLPGIVLYERGDVDVTEVDIGSLDRVAETRNPLSRDLVVTPLLSTWYIGMNAQTPPFDDPLVRRAFAHATDRDRFVRVFYRETRAPARSILPPGLPGYDAEAASTSPPLDLPRARQLLAQSRYAGRMPEVVLSVGSGSASTGEALAEMYVRNLGVDVGVREWGEEFPSLLERRQAQMFLTGWIADYPHPENFLDILFHSRSSANYGGFAQPQLDQLLESARVERDEARRADLYLSAERTILGEAAAIPLHHETTHALVRPWVKGLVVTPLGILSYREVEVGERTVERPAA